MTINLKPYAVLKGQTMWDKSLENAIEKNNLSQISGLMSMGSNPNELNETGDLTLLTMYIRSRPTDLTTFRAIINHKKFEFTVETVMAVLEAVISQQPDLANLLLAKIDTNKNISVDACEKGERTALSYAVQYNYIDTTRLLLEHGANPNAGNLEKSNTPLCMSLSNDTLFKLLLDAPQFTFEWSSIDAIRLAIISKAFEKAIAIINKHTPHSVPLDSVLFNGKTILMLALEYRATSIFTRLIVHGANPQHQPTPNAETPLCYAVKKCDLTIVDKCLSDARFKFTSNTLSAVKIALTLPSLGILALLLKYKNRISEYERTLSDISYAKYITTPEYITKLRAAEQFCNSYMHNESFSSRNIAVIGSDGNIYSKNTFILHNELRTESVLSYMDYAVLSDYCLQPSLQNLYKLSLDPLTGNLMEQPVIVIFTSGVEHICVVCAQESLEQLPTLRRAGKVITNQQHKFTALITLLAHYKNELSEHHSNQKSNATQDTWVEYLNKILKRLTDQQSDHNIFSKVFASLRGHDEIEADEPFLNQRFKIN